MKNPFTLSWSKPKAVADLPKYQEVSTDMLARLSSYSETVLGALRESLGAEVGYNETAVKRLSDELSAKRLGYHKETKIKIANLYGCFLGTSVMQTYKDYDGRWVQYNGELGILLSASHGALTKITFPISRAFKHIESGDDYSLYSYFIAIPEFVTSNPSK